MKHLTVLFVSCTLWLTCKADNVTDTNTNDSSSLVRYAVSLPDSMKQYLGYPEDSLLNFTERVTKYGYECEEHTVTTEDGYLLTTFRVNNKSCLERGPPVYLLHGLFLTADSFLDLGPGAALVHHLADECYDLWVGNSRGNYYARRHLTLNPDTDAEFWQFSTDEMGYYDVPASIDYVLQQSGRNKLGYIGYSQGCTAALIACTERPEYNDKINVFIALAPASRLYNSKSLPFYGILSSGYVIERFLNSSIKEALFIGGVMQSVMEFACQSSMLQSYTKEFCAGFINLMESSSFDAYSESALKTIFAHFPAGTSTRTMARFTQGYYLQDMRKYDFGSATENRLAYGTDVPPAYNLSAVSVPVLILQGRGDYLVAPEDSEWLAAQLQNASLRYIDDATWNHWHMVFRKDAPTLLFPPISEILMEYQSGN